MKIKTLIKCMALASILPASTMMIANDDVPDEEKVIALTNKTNNAFNEPNYTWSGTGLCVDAGSEDCTITITDKATAGENYFQTYKGVQQAIFSNLEKSEYTLCIENGFNCKKGGILKIK